MPDLNGKLCLITGATSGLGRAIAYALGARGADLVLAGRNLTAGNKVVSHIRNLPHSGSAEFIRTDISAQQEVHRLATRMNELNSPIHLLVNNAGARFNRYGESADGIERTFATNFLGHFLLSSLLLKSLLKSPTSHVITIASSAHLSVNDAGDWYQSPNNYNRDIAYSNSKLANIMFAFEFARRLAGTNITSNAVDPGFVASHFSRNNGLISWIKHITYYALKRQLISAKKSAESISKLVSRLEEETVSGKYFYENREINSSAMSHNPEVARNLWSLSVKLSCLNSNTGSTWAYLRP